MLGILTPIACAVVFVLLVHTAQCGRLQAGALCDSPLRRRARQNQKPRDDCRGAPGTND
jgi:hypothetical protein